LCRPGRAAVFTRDLVNTLISYHPTNLILLTGASTEDVELSIQRKFYYGCDATHNTLTAVYPKLASYLDSLQQLNLPSSISKASRPVVLSYSQDEVSLAPYGMVITKHVIDRVAQMESQGSEGTPTLLVLGKFVEEGDNSFDGLELASSLCSILGLTDTALLGDKLNVPHSWRVRFYGQGKSNRSEDYPMLY
jgi:hypothetical protein